MALKKKQDWVGKFEELFSNFPYLDRSELLPKETSDCYYRAVALLHEALKDPHNTTMSSMSEFRVNPAAAFRLRYITPCLAVAVDDLSADKRDELFTSRSWVFTHKRNGVRAWVVYMSGFLAVYSRNYSTEDGRLLDYAKHLEPVICGCRGFSRDFVLDVEVELADDVDVSVLERLGLPLSPLDCIVALLGSLSQSCSNFILDYKRITGRDLVHINLIVPLYWGGHNFINRRLADSYAVKDEVVSVVGRFLPCLRDIGRVGGSQEEKVSFLESLLAVGAEGVVAHNMDGFYSTSVNRRKDVFVKIKRSVSATNLRGESFDAWISGYELGLKGSRNENRISTLVLSVYLYDTKTLQTVEHIIARVSGLSDKVVRELSDYSGSVPVLRKEMYDRVVEVDGQSISSVSWHLTHSRFVRFRDDKSKEDCRVTSDFLESCTDRVAFHTRL
jgi:hypothetical protein